MFEAYELLCNDKIWIVRQACARVVSEISRLCRVADAADSNEGGAFYTDREQQAASDTNVSRGAMEWEPEATAVAAAVMRRQRADELQIRLLRMLYLDTLLPSDSQWVVTAAKQQVGSVLTTLRPGPPSSELLPPLLESYCTAAAAVGQRGVEVRRRCAESFGDVLEKVREYDSNQPYGRSARAVVHYQQFQTCTAKFVLLTQASG